ncbi:MAG TPA: TonB C-terminal domain-containing protein [Candidatus Sulfotelmatobacter sp.]|nr:TonB C-terminal domain-containing protein [Candidatus Sulfotelmatobacter sp.]
MHYLPLWLDEGTAELYAYTRFQSHRIYVGAPTERYRTLRGGTPIPVEKFIGLGPRSPYYIDGSQNQLYYAESWALVHYLIYGEGMENGKRFDQFSNLLQQGVTQKDAFRQVFGDFKKVDQGLGSYMLQPTFRTTILKDSPAIDEKSFLIRVMSIAETEAELGGFHVWTRDLRGAHELLDQALKDDPKLALAHEQMGFLNFAEGKDSQAETEFAEAYALDQSLYLSLFYRVMLSALASSNNVTEMNAFAGTLGKVLQLNPNFAPAYVALVKLALREGDLNSALQISRKAEQLEPSLAGYHLLTGQVLKRVGKTADAGAYAKFVADRWIGSDHDEAVELWNSLPAADRPQLQPSETELSDIEKGAQISEGKIKLVSCGDADNERSLVLEDNGHALTFRGKGFVTGFSDTLWYGEDHFDLCHHLEGRRVMVRYRPTADASYAGEIAELGIRDDLPGPLEAALQSVSLTPETKPQDQDSSEQKTQNQDFGLGIGARGKQLGALDILSDTEGVDFGPYLQKVLEELRENWYHLIPESAETKKGKLAIEFAITKDGKVADMKLVASSGDVALDRPAWGSITASNPFKHLPSDFTGPYLALRVRFYYNPDKNDLPDSNNRRVGHNKSTPPVPQLKVRSGIKVSVYPPINLLISA